MKSTFYRTGVFLGRKDVQPGKNLLVLCPLYPPHTGGLQNHAEQFNHHLAEHGFDITVFTPHLISKTPVDEIPRKGIRVLRFPAWEIIPNYPIPKLWHPLFWQQLFFILRQPIDTIISRTRFFVTSPLAFLIAKLKGAHWMHIEHGSGYVQLNNPVTSWLARMYDQVIGRLIFRLADTVVGNSHASAAFVRRFAPQRKVEVIYRGVEIQRIKEIPASNLPYNEKILISYVGRLIDGKGVADLVHAFSQLKDTSPRLVLIGNGPQYQALVALAKKLRIENRVTFYGDTPWEKSISLLKASDIVVNPSYAEGLPTSVIEAAFCGCTIVATDVGGTKEVITHNQSGILIPPRNIEQLRLKLHELINDKDKRMQLAARARQDIASKFSWDTALAQYQELLLR